MVALDVSEWSKIPQNLSWHTQLGFCGPNSHPPLPNSCSVQPVGKIGLFPNA